MTSLILHFNEAAVTAMEGSTRIRALMKKRGGKEFLGLRPSYRVSGKNMQLKTIKGEDGSVSTELPTNFIKELKFERPENGTAFFLKSIGYGWFILDEFPVDASGDLPTVVISDSAHVKQAAKAAAAEEKTSTEVVDATPEAPVDAQTAEAKEAGATSSAAELAAHFGLNADSDATPEVIDGDKTGAVSETPAEATPAPAKKTAAAKKAVPASKKSPSKAIAKPGTSKKKPAAKKAATA